MKELPIHIQLQPESSKTLYEQIYEYIREEIKSGSLMQNEKLPSARFLADYLQVSRTTVDMAYDQLVSEGYLEAKPRRGYFVSTYEELAAIGETPVRHDNVGGTGSRRDNAERACGWHDSAESVGGPQDGAKRVESRRASDTAAEADGRDSCSGEQGQEPPIHYDFSPNAIDMRYFPYATWKKITRNILVDANSKMFSLGEPQGDPELRMTICRYLHGSRGVNCEPEQIIIGAGNDYLLLLLEKILGRHVCVAMENPTYVRAYKIFRSCAYPVRFIPMDESGMRVDSLRRTEAQVAYVMPSHQYPTGVSMPIGRRMELLKWAAEAEGRYLIEDDYDSEFRYKGKPLPSLQASDHNGRVVYIGTFSKAIAPAIRISYMVLPYPLLERYRRECGFYASTVSRIDQTILNEFIQDGYFERYLNKMRKRYREKHELVLNALRPFERAFHISGSNAGLHMLLTDRRGRSEDALAEAAAQEGVRVYQMRDFRMGESAEDAAMLILGYGALTEDEISEGIERLKNVWL